MTLSAVPIVMRSLIHHGYRSIPCFDLCFNAHADTCRSLTRCGHQLNSRRLHPNVECTWHQPGTPLHLPFLQLRGKPLPAAINVPKSGKLTCGRPSISVMVGPLIPVTALHSLIAARSSCLFTTNNQTPSPTSGFTALDCHTP